MHPRILVKFAMCWCLATPYPLSQERRVEHQGRLVHQMMEEGQLSRVLMESIEGIESRMLVLLSRILPRKDARVRVKQYHQMVNQNSLTVLAPGVAPDPHIRDAY